MNGHLKPEIHAPPCRAANNTALAGGISYVSDTSHYHHLTEQTFPTTNDDFFFKCLKQSACPTSVLLIPTPMYIHVQWM